VDFSWKCDLTIPLSQFLKEAKLRPPLKLHFKLANVEDGFFKKKAFYSPKRLLSSLKKLLLLPIHYFSAKLVVVSSNYPLSLFNFFGRYFYSGSSPSPLTEKFVKWFFGRLGSVEAQEIQKALEKHSACDTSRYNCPFDEWSNYEFDLVYHSSQDPKWERQKLHIKIDNKILEGELLFRKDFLEEKRWTLFSLGNGELLEFRRNCRDTYNYLTQIRSGALFFNYPGVGKSQGWPKKSLILKAYYALLKLLEDPDGLGAKDIIGYGWSLGGGVQSEALQYHPFKTSINYVFVKDRTFSSLVRTIIDVAGTTLSKISKFSKWDLNSFASSTWLSKHNIPEVIVQCGFVAYESTIDLETNSHFPLKEISQIRDDVVITKQASLAKKILETPSFPKESQNLFITKENHSGRFYLEPLIKTIQNLLRSDY
jgi:hypothetical protein